MTLLTETITPDVTNLENPTLVTAIATIRRDVARLNKDERVRKLLSDNAERQGALVVDLRGDEPEIIDDTEQVLAEFMNPERIEAILTFSKLPCDLSRNNTTSVGKRCLAKRIDRSTKRGWQSTYQGRPLTQQSAEKIIYEILQSNQKTIIMRRKSTDIYGATGEGIRIDDNERPFVTFLESGYQE